MNQISRLSLLAALLALPLAATANSGLVLYSKGEVRIERGTQSRLLVRGARVQEGDVIETGANGRTHIRMADRTLLSLRPDTRLAIEEYSYSPPPTPRPVLTKDQQTAAADEASGRSFFGLVKGGFRTITGIIGKRDNTSFGIRTPVATIGIRGTTFDTVCINECRDGLLAAAWDGTIVASNSADSIEIVTGEILRVPGAGLAPRIDMGPHPELDEGRPKGVARGPGGVERRIPNSLVLRRIANNNRAAGGGPRMQRPGNVDDPVTRGTNDPRPFGFQDIAYATGPFNTATGGDAIQLSSRPDLMQFASNGALTGFAGAIPLEADGGLDAAVVRTGGVNAVSILNVGFDPAVGTRWGRYSDGDLRLTTRDGDGTLPLNGQSLHWATSAVTGSRPAVPATGTRRYEVFGNTDPTNNAGHTGILGDASLSADFGALSVSSTVSLGINNRVWSASGTGAMGSALSATARANAFAGSYDSVNVGGASGSGDFAGFFTQGAAGAGMSYVLRQAGGGEIVSGALSFRASQ